MINYRIHSEDGVWVLTHRRKLNPLGFFSSREEAQRRLDYELVKDEHAMAISKADYNSRLQQN